jgi:hypothetical protein
MRNSRCLARTTRFVPWIAAMGLAIASPACAEDLLGVFFDTSAQTCSGNVPTAGTATLYVCCVPTGSASGGITGAEFRIDPGNGGYLVQGGSPMGSGWAVIGNAFSGGVNVAFGECLTGSAIAILQFTVLNPGGGAHDSELHVIAKSRPSNPNFPCPLVTLCDDPAFTTVCVEGGKTILNPSAPRPCGSSRENTVWSRVKGLYR